MAHFKRHKPRRTVKCVLCTPHRWGNGRGGDTFYRRRYNPLEEEFRSLELASLEDLHLFENELDQTDWRR